MEIFNGTNRLLQNKIYDMAVAMSENGMWIFFL